MPAQLTCPKCNTPNVQPTEAGQFRCAQCNTQLELRPVSEGDVGYCSQCRAIVLSNAHYCHRCGAEVQTLNVSRSCSICGKAIPVVSVFCPYCRAQLDLPESIGCPACGKTIAPDFALCPYCGADVEGFLAPLRLQIPIALRPCPNCGKPAPVASSFCVYCRKPIVLPEDQGRARQWVDCPSCWRTVVPEEGKCPSCGADVKQAAAPRRPKLPSVDAELVKQPWRDRLEGSLMTSRLVMLLILALVIFVLLMGLFLLIALRSQGM
jgi:predicted amidophosphoribosyltransferase